MTEKIASCALSSALDARQVANVLANGGRIQECMGVCSKEIIVSPTTLAVKDIVPMCSTCAIGYTHGYSEAGHEVRVGYAPGAWDETSEALAKVFPPEQTALLRRALEAAGICEITEEEADE